MRYCRVCRAFRIHVEDEHGNLVCDSCRGWEGYS